MSEQDRITAAHPIKTGRHDLYDEARRLVGERHDKGDLVDLVNWLLVERERAETERDQLAKLAKVPKGWELAPVTPTREMLIHKGCGEHDPEVNPCHLHDRRRQIWAAMMEVVPDPDPDAPATSLG